ncbi:MAG: molybdopterin-dependent oxidoreductase [Pseudomonadota bacterium]
MKVGTVVETGRVKTLCRMCNSRCSITVHIRDGVITEITPAEGNPVNNGRICPRGKSAADFFYHPERICRPLKRRPDGSFEEISRDRALDEIAAKMTELKDRHGARAVGVWKGEGVGFQQQEGYVRRFIKAFGSPNYFSNDSVCFNGRFLGHALVTGFWNPYPVFSSARLIVLLGTNPPVCHPPFMAEFADARAKGARLVVIDPRLNPIGCRADVFAQPRPGADAALIWGLINLVIESGGYDSEFIKRYTVGFEKVATYARRFTPGYVERETGILAEATLKIADLIRECRPHISFYSGAGLEHHQNGVDNIRTAAILACLCGGIDIDCGLAWPEKIPLSDLTLRDRGAPDPGEPIGADRFPAFFRFTREGHSLTAVDYMLGRGEYPLKGLIVMAANPAVTNPNTDKVVAALKSLDLLVVHEFFMTATARAAHYILPGATFLERSEIHVNSKFQRIHLTAKVAEVEGIESGYFFWRDLAQRLGFGEQYFPWKDETEVNRFLLQPSGIALEDLEARPEGLVYKSVRRKKYDTEPFPTPSGRVEFASAYLKSLGLPEIPEYQGPGPQATTEYPFILTTGGRMTLFYLSRHQNIKKFRLVHQRAQMEIHPDDAAALGIADRDEVRIFSRVGELRVEARVVHRAELRRGVVEVYHGWEESPINRVIPDDVNDPISGFPVFKRTPVGIERTGGPRP